MEGSSNSFDLEELEEIIDDFDFDDLHQSDACLSPPFKLPSVNSSQIFTWTIQVLNEVQACFAFHKAAKALETNSERVKEVIILLDEQLQSCIVRKSKVSGTNREESQKCFFKLVSGGMWQLTALTGNHQLSTWLALQVFNRLVDLEFRSDCEDNAATLVTSAAITSEESDIAHYIGGCVISKLQRRKKDEEKEVLAQLVSEELPQEGTLLYAKSRGRLTNITTDGKAMFIEMEQVFRDLLAESKEKINEEHYKSACLKNNVIQDCYFTSVYACSNTDKKDQILSDILQLYFKIRIHHKCKIILDSVRAKTKMSSKDRALRSKLAK